jgi:hypothetical protein
MKTSETFSLLWHDRRLANTNFIRTLKSKDLTDFSTASRALVFHKILTRLCYLLTTTEEVSEEPHREKHSSLIAPLRTYFQFQLEQILLA